MEIIISPCQSRSYKTWSLLSPLCCSSPLSLSWNPSLTCPTNPARIPAFEARLNPQDRQDLSLGINFDEANHISNTTLKAACAPLPFLQPAHPPSSPPMANCVLCSALLIFPPKSTLAVVFGFPNPNYPFTTSPQGSECLQAPRRE